ncbi:unnamed protein product [Darwinula stevensoni]|uniref:C2H2-type domain-containing protein n=1 Tax=Darwinula stevensoni TaxID=69355 RepID=A0A7R8WY41_9CRUS|nr:unnamed protein product [Darwinula stevensoni]CAG0878979.1 unnamed protein product [Darwinula stevensoni]
MSRYPGMRPYAPPPFYSPAFPPPPSQVMRPPPGAFDYPPIYAPRPPRLRPGGPMRGRMPMPGRGGFRPRGPFPPAQPPPMRAHPPAMPPAESMKGAPPGGLNTQPPLPPPPPPPDHQNGDFVQMVTEEVPVKVEPEVPTPGEETGSSEPTPPAEDPPLPQELIDQMKPKHCMLCDIKLNSDIQAKMHYEGKQHLKKVRNFMINHCRQNKLPLPTKFRVDQKTSPNEQAARQRLQLNEESDLYCKICQISFSSALHAQQHYMGRNHQRRLEGKPPLKTGYFNKHTGKWQRLPPNEVPDPKAWWNRDKGKRKATEPLSPGEKQIKITKLQCTLCGISTTGEDQMNMHMNGAKHQQMLRNAGVPSAPPGN